MLEAVIASLWDCLLECRSRIKLPFLAYELALAFQVLASKLKLFIRPFKRGILQGNP